MFYLFGYFYFIIFITEIQQFTNHHILHTIYIMSIALESHTICLPSNALYKHTQPPKVFCLLLKIAQVCPDALSKNPTHNPTNN